MHKYGDTWRQEVVELLTSTVILKKERSRRKERRKLNRNEDKRNIDRSDERADTANGE